MKGQVAQMAKMMAMDKKAFSKASASDRAVVYEVMNKLFTEVDEENRVDNEKAYEVLISQGIQVTTPAPEDLPAWYAVANKSVKELRESGDISEQSLDLYQKLLEEFRQSPAP